MSQVETGYRLNLTVSYKGEWSVARVFYKKNIG